ncbi:hypothetical protein Hanom_Chr09g00838941 [Helianthus anomalus]
MQANQIGIVLITHFTSSICCMLHSVHRLPDDPLGLILSFGVMIAALFKNLLYTRLQNVI